MFYSNNEATNFNNNIKNTENFESFKYKTKFLGNTVTQPAPNITNGILKNVKIAFPLKYWIISGDHLKCHWLIKK